jgi:hypothetical protein
MVDTLTGISALAYYHKELVLALKILLPRPLAYSASTAQFYKTIQSKNLCFDIVS